MSKELQIDHGHEENSSPKKRLLDQYDQAKRDLGPLDAFEKCLREPVKHTKFDNDQRKDLQQKVDLLQSVVKNEIREEKERLGPGGSSDLLLAFEERERYFDASLARYDADHPTLPEKRKHSTWGGNGFMDQVRASERTRHFK